MNNRKALLVGVSDYLYEQATLGDMDSKSALEDVAQVYRVLTERGFGYGEGAIRVLTGRRATRKNILKRLGWLIANTDAGTHCLFYFSGHGARIRCRDEKSDELKDHMDEVLCPSDTYWDGGYITDDDLEDHFKKMSAGTLEVVLETCASGGMEEFVFAGPAPRQGRARPRYLAPPPDIEYRSHGTLLPCRCIGRTKYNRNRGAHNILWAAAGKSQAAYSDLIEGSQRGLFTHYFCKHLLARNGNVTRGVLQRLVGAELRTYLNLPGPQEPELVCEEGEDALLSQPVFTPWREPPPRANMATHAKRASKHLASKSTKAG